MRGRENKEKASRVIILPSWFVLSFLILKPLTAVTLFSQPPCSVDKENITSIEEAAEFRARTVVTREQTGHR